MTHHGEYHMAHLWTQLTLKKTEDHHQLNQKVFSSSEGVLTIRPRKTQIMEIHCQLFSVGGVLAKTRYIPPPTPFCTFAVNKDVYNTAIAILLV